MLKKHLGVILKPSKVGFDVGASSFICAFVDEEEPHTTYLYYSGAKDTKRTHAGIGLAISHNGEQFRKVAELNPLIDGESNQFNSRESVTPAVVRISNYYYMLFAGSKRVSKLQGCKLWTNLFDGRKIGIAYADDPKGPWKTLGVVAKPERYWEGWSIDLGPNVVKLDEREILVYYSNVNSKVPFSIRFSRRFLCRSIGILKIKINSPSSIEVLKYEGNPLKYLNGPKGSQNESLFCPGCLLLDNIYLFLPTMTSYFVGYPYPQFIGLISDNNPYFNHAKKVSVVINGPMEKKDIMPNVKGEICLDTPSPIVREDKVYLYYSVMDRSDMKWKTALTIIVKQLFKPPA